MVFSSGWGVGGLNDISRWGRERHRSLAAFTVAFFAMQVCHYDNTRHWNADVGSGDADLRQGENRSCGRATSQVWGLSVFLSETQNQIDNATVQDIATVAPPFGIILDGFARQIQIWNTCALSLIVILFQGS